MGLNDLIMGAERIDVPAELFDQTIREAKLQGWKIDRLRSNDKNAYFSRDGNHGSALAHIVVGAFTGVMTLGMGNAVYGMYKKSATTKHLHIVSVPSPMPRSTDESAQATRDALLRIYGD